MRQLPVTVQDASVQVVWHVQEVEKEVMEEVPGKKPRKRSHRQMEYCYEPELEGAIFGAAICNSYFQQGSVACISASRLFAAPLHVCLPVCRPEPR